MERSDNKKNSKEIAHFFWNGPMNDMVVNCVKSHIKNNFIVKLWSYENHYIKGAESLNASDIIDKKDIYFANTGIIISFKYKDKRIMGVEQFSDVFRIKLWAMYGGWWFDTDSFCLKDQLCFKELRKDKDLVVPQLYYEGLVPSNTNIFMNIKTGKLALNCFNDYINSKIEGLSYIKYGSSFINYLLKTNKINHIKLMPELFTPIHWDDINDIYIEDKKLDLIKTIKNSFAVHFYNKMNKKKYNLENNLINYLYKKIK